MGKQTQNKHLNKRSLFFFSSCVVATIIIVAMLLFSGVAPNFFQSTSIGSNPQVVKPLYFNGYNETFEDDYTPIIEYDDTGWLSPTYNIDTGSGFQWIDEANSYAQDDTYARSLLIGSPSPQGVQDYKISLYIDGTLDGDDKGNDANLPSSDTDTYWYYGGSSDNWSLALTETDVEDTGNTGFGVCLKYYDNGTDDYTHYLILTKFGINIPSGATVEGIEVGIDAYNTETEMNEDPKVDHVMMKIYYSEGSKGPAVPDEYWYNFTGTGNTTDAYAHTDNMSLYLNLTGNEVGNFTWDTVDNYYEYDMYFALGENHSTIRLYPTCNSTDNLSYLPYILINTTSTGVYNSAYDLDDDGDVDEWEIDELGHDGHSGETGPPGWIKEDMNADGIVNFLDISWFASHRGPMSVQTNAYFVWDGSNTYLYYNGSYIYGANFSYRLNSNSIVRYNGDLIWHRLEIYFPVVHPDMGTDGVAVGAMYNEQEDNALMTYDGLMYGTDLDNITYFTEEIFPWGLTGNVTGYYPNPPIMMQTGLMFTTDDTSDFYLDDLSLLETPNDILDVDETPANGSTDVNYYGAYEFMLNMTDTQNPYLLMSIYTWDGAYWVGPIDYYYLDDYFYSYPYVLDFDTTYYWYVNITTTPDEQWSWEFPTSGTIIGGKYCYVFETMEYQPPTADNFSPVNGAINVSVNCSCITLSCDVHYSLPNSVRVDYYYWDEDTTSWEVVGNQYVNDGNTSSWCWSPSLDWFDAYGETFYWRIEIYDETDDYYITYPYLIYPNATQSSVWRGGYHAFNFSTETDDPPYVYEYYPHNNTLFNPYRETIYVSAYDNTTCDTLTGDMWLVDTQNVTDELGNPVNWTEWHIDSCQIPSKPNMQVCIGCGTNNLTIYDPPLARWLSTILWYDGDYGYYRVNITDASGQITQFPDGWGTFIEGNYYINFTVDAEINTSDIMNITYPLNTTYTKTQWRDDHELTYTCVQNTNYDTQVFMLITPSWLNYPNYYCQYRDFFSTTTDGVTFVYPTGGSIDLSDYVSFEDTTYDVQIGLIYRYNDYEVIYTYDTVEFTIGDPSNELPYHMSIKDCTPANGDKEAYESLSSGIQFYLSVNSTNDLYHDRFYYAVRDDSNNKMLQNGMGKWDNFENWWDYGHPYYLKQLMSALAPNHLYTVYFGRLMNNSDYDDFQLDNLYDDNAVECWFGWKNGWGELREGDGYSTDYPYHGWKTSFGYYPDDWTSMNKYDTSDTINAINLLIPGGQYLVFLCIIAGFTLMPYIISRRYKKDIPSMVMMSFFIMGCIVGYAMGLIDMWLFIIPTIIILVLMLYRTVHKYAKSSEPPEGVKGGEK